ncbi:ABC transporter ATP-binding protein [Prochlorococcus marinus]|uniref:ABC transporter ATP-binding protein n=1 Tax=Prochlorococcus marinus TaxID=1219 RepID=UPI0009E43766|nr:ABC transporter ATP-binding protein [Prochlorococcus marinus]
MNSSAYLINNVWKVIPSNLKRSTYLFFVMLMISGVFELFTLTILFPFLLLITNNDVNTIKIPFLELINENLFDSSFQYKDTLNVISLILLVVIIVSALFRLFTIYVLHNQVAKISTYLSSVGFKNTLSQKYSYHIKQNSSSTISLSTHQVTEVYQGVTYFFQFIYNFALCFCIFISLLIISPKVTLISFLSLSILFLIISMFMKQRLLEIGNIVTKSSELQVKLMQESLGSIKNIIVNDLIKKYSDAYSKKDYLIRKKTAVGNFLSVFPRYITESFILIVVIISIYFFSISERIDTSVYALVGTFALAMQKLLPALQQSYGAWSSFKTKSRSIKNLINRIYLKVEKENKDKENYLIPLHFNNEIEFKNVSYRYDNKNSYILKNINLKIKKFSKIGLIGETGSGKTTFVDLLVGLLTPTNGEILVDGVNINNSTNIFSWYKKVAYVSQNIYLSDSSILSNITSTFDDDFDKKIDENLVISAAKKAYIHNYINSLPNKYETRVGERGLQLSGGQIQRIALARAIFKKAEIIVLDEPTSALDSSTEEILMKSIYSNFKKATIIIIAHRTSTLNNCDMIFEIKNKSFGVV